MPTGPRACSRPVAMPISAPKPNSPPSANCGRGIMQHDRRIDLAQEFRRCGLVLGDDRVGVTRTVTLDMRDRRIDAVDHPGGDDGVKIFGVPIGFARRLHAAVDRLHRGVAADFAAGVEQHEDQRLEQFRRSGPIDEQRLGRSAHAGAAHLGVEHDRLGHRELRLGVDIDMADAFKMREDRHARLRLHAGDQILAAARHDDIECAIEPGEHRAHGGAFPCRHQRDRGGRQSGIEQTFDQRGMHRARRAETFGTAAQDRGVAGLEAKRAGIDGDVGPAFVDHADDTERDPHALDAHAVRTPPRRQNRADRVLELADDVETGGGVRDALGVKRQPIEKGRGRAGGLRLRHVFGVGGEDCRLRPANGLGHGSERFILLCRRRQREGARRAAAPRDRSRAWSLRACRCSRSP